MIKVTINELLAQARLSGCSDVHITLNAPPIFRQNSRLFFTDYEKLTKQDIDYLINPLLNDKINTSIKSGEDADFAYTTPDGLRHRVNLYRQKGAFAAAFRLLNDTIPTLQSLGLPAAVEDFCKLDRGLVLVTGPTGSGKSTTLASMIDYINNSYNKHIITIEDPIEYVHSHRKCMVNQRELGEDIGSFSDAVRSALREDPDVILVGEMRDLATISAAVTAAETGHLVFSTLHTTGAATTIDRIIDIFPQGQQSQMRIQLAMVLKGIVSQQLLPKSDKTGRVAAVELLKVTDSIANLIRENKAHQINSMIQTGAVHGMQSLDADLARLVNNNIVDLTVAQEKCVDKTTFNNFLSFRPMGY